MPKTQKVKIVIGGKEYSSFDEFPPELRETIKAKLKSLKGPQIRKAIFKTAGLLLTGRGLDIPSKLLSDLLDDPTISATLETKDDEDSKLPQNRTIERQAAVRANIDSNAFRGQHPGVEVSSSGFGRLAIGLLILGGAAAFFFRR